METGISKRLPGIFVFGLACLCLALIVLTFAVYMGPRSIRETGFVLTHFMLLLYFFVIWLSGHLKRNPHRRKLVAIFVLLLLVDAYTVNTSMAVFDATTPWFAIILVLMGANILAFSWFEESPEWVKCLQCALLGFTFLAPVYLACYLLNMYIISIIGLIAIGISLVTFSPIFVIWFHTRMVRKLVWPIYRYRFIYLCAMGLAVMIIAAYAFLYATKVNAMDRIYGQTTPGTTDMPGWIRVAQEPMFGPVTEMILRTGITYRAPEMDAFGFFDMPSQREYDSEVKHDPLFVLSAFIFGRTSIPEEDRVKILSVAYDKRHFAEERLWGGRHLATTNVNTRADLWPHYHLAYTENTIVVNNEGEEDWRLWNEEAIYTFHLPEGGVVTSLSLWINNREEKGILTTKQKADSAYKEIVGHQYRDPSVVHWQEGNRVVVRVFPVPPHGKRQFKIGITAPLKVQDGQLLYQPTWFEGPSAEHADYKVSLNMQQWPKEMATPSGFFHDDNRLAYLGNYHPNWELKIPNETIDNAAFNFNGQRYTLLPYTPAYEFFTPANYYLDVNQSWHYNDYLEIISKLKDKPVWVFHPQKGWTAVNALNKKNLFEDLLELNFSLFPFHLIPQPATAMVITASGQTSPQLSDLGETTFQNSLRSCFNKQRIRLYDIGQTLSPYLATLKESRSLIYEKGSLEQLLSQISKNSFLKPEESSSQLIMASSGIRIARSADSTPTQGPDHLARLFAYNYILQELGPRVAAADAGKDSLLVQVAKEAYVVSPLSSLIVLETQADYDQFGIKDDNNALKNASLNGHGAVPEPHEWALFIVAVSLLFYVRFEKLLFRKKGKAC
ncbi:MAG: XrtN system VIT domain-containing protein [Chitinophaga sp.]|uniref:XrtN system VIT domain-containing protein n=1 Tax=Chitinophaga sp. TaxID=1869181 RepID=UPI001B29FAD4|nr:XrtN system VIT domain-containing protein [Chitinophaga sp.]MBO9732733.1 XrtN system VIT domain-containing protein [Chitinophaga sp.]